MQRLRSVARLGAGLAVLASAACTLAACNKHPVTFNRSTGAVEYIQTTSVDGSTKLDMLWVIDNSGSMCQEQSILRNNFNLFIEQLDRTNLDFHIGVTTTDMNADYPLEPVAQPGYLQSTPQPVPGFDRSCHTAVTDAGEQIQGNYQPIKDAIKAAVDCMATPDTSLLDPTNADIECALYGEPAGCSIARAGCGGAGDPCQSEDLFPDPSSYRAIPKVLKSEDYKNGATLDVDRLKADFACMSLVGTRGYGIEKGLEAAVAATDPELTGGAAGADDADPTAPNHGLIRQNSRFAVVFVTDENDCTHDGSLDETTPCGGDVCEFANREALGADSPLVDPAVLRESLVDNVKATKNEADFGDADTLVASIHGNYRRYDQATPPTSDQCSAAEYDGIQPSCATALGVAYSGDRYERFLREFAAGQYYPAPAPQNPDAPLTGWMCTGDFRPALEAIGEFFTSAASGCITRDIFPCESSDACPDFPYDEGAGTCVERPNSESGEMYCDSAVQVRAVANNTAALDNLRNSGYCIESSIGDEGLAQGCVISGDRYTFEPCSGGVSGIRLQWNAPQEARNALLNSDLQLRYNSVSSN